MAHGLAGIRMNQRNLIRPATAPPAHKRPVNRFPTRLPIPTELDVTWVREVGSSKHCGMRAFVAPRNEGIIIYQANWAKMARGS
jgi:hypothetical protein